MNNRLSVPARDAPVSSDSRWPSEAPAESGPTSETELASSATRDEAIRAFFAQRFSVDVPHVQTEPIGRKKSPEHGSRYFKCSVTLGGAAPKTIVVFVKTAVLRPAQVEKRESFLATLSFPEFRTPGFYGMIDLVNGREGTVDRAHALGFWEYVSGRTTGFADCTPDDLNRIVGAAAAMHAETDDAMGNMPYLPAQTLKPMAQDVLSALEDFRSRGTDVRELVQLTERFERIEPGVLADFNGAGRELFFSHMDLSAANIFLKPADEPLIIIDWDSACLAPAGASLRNLATLEDEAQEKAIAHFVRALAGKGIAADVRDVLFVMRCVQVYASLTWGARRSAAGKRWRRLPADDKWQRYLDGRAEAQVRWGLEHIPYLEG